MSLATWQDLCIDAIDVGMQSEFWAAVSGLDIPDGEAPARLGGPTPAHSLWVNPVDRPHRVKNRVHLDVYCASIDDLVDLGASVLQPSEETGFGWTVMADPEGNEFCAFVRTPDRLPDYRIHGIGIDCGDAGAQARWWGELFGAEPEFQPEYDVWTLTGVAVDETSITLGVKHKFSGSWIGHAKLGYFESKNDTSGGRSDYHGPLAYVAFEYGL